MEFAISEDALKKIVSLRPRVGDAPYRYLRVGINEQAQACCGPAYMMDFADDGAKGEELVFVFESEHTFCRDSFKLTVLIETKWREVLNGAEVVLVQTPMGEKFKINNPNVQPSCACGK